MPTMDVARSGRSGGRAGDKGGRGGDKAGKGAEKPSAMAAILAAGRDGLLKLPGGLDPWRAESDASLLFMHAQACACVMKRHFRRRLRRANERQHACGQRLGFGVGFDV